MAGNRPGTSRFWRRRPDLPETTPVLRPIPAWTWTLIALTAVLVTATVVTVVLMTIADHAAPGTPLANARMDAIRTGLAAGGGAGAAIGLMLAFRRQHHQEVATALTDYDATQRRITEMYGRAADQLGSDKAPVRLAGLYALERLAQESPASRQTIVNLLCAYLRMPYSPPPEFTQLPARIGPHPQKLNQLNGTQKQAAIKSSSSVVDTTAKPEAHEELQVRRAAQRILADHLGAHGQVEGLLRSPALPWGDLTVDLSGSLLIDFNLSNATVGDVSFYGAKFVSAADFRDVTFSGTANFACASFDRFGCYFDHASFVGDVYFGDTSFTEGCSDFRGATFHSDVRFGGVSVRPNGIDLTGARVTNLDALLEWPAGWKLEPKNEEGVGELRYEGPPLKPGSNRLGASSA
jgi:hypothetical protein